MRKVAPIDPKEVREYQVRHGLTVDGKVGNQTWGQVLDDEHRLNVSRKANELLHKEIRDLKEGRAGMFIVGLVFGALIMAALFMMFA